MSAGDESARRELALGHAALADGHHDIAAAHYEAVTRAAPAQAAGWLGLAQAQEGCGRPLRACQGYQQALSLGLPDPDPARLRLGLAAMSVGRIALAAENFSAVHASSPGNAMALYGLGLVAAAGGKFDSARAHFRAALELDPALSAAAQHLAACQRFSSLNDPDALLVAALAKRVDLDTRSQEQVAFALAKIYDDCARYDEAWAFFSRANALHASRQPAFDAAAMAKLVDGLIAAFPRLPTPLSAVPSADAPPPPRPIFILGMPRSGTTLLERLLAGHSRIAAGGENSVLDRAIQRQLAPWPTSLPGQPEVALRGLAALYHEESAAKASAQQPPRTADHRPGQALDATSGVSAISDAFPGNFLHAGLLMQLFPDASFVHCRRDPRDTGLSIWCADFGQGNEFASDLTAIAACYRQYARLLEHWYALAPRAILTVDYEVLVHRPEEQLRRILAHCGLAWEYACLDVSQAPGDINTLSRWQSRQPLHARSVGRWQAYRKYLQPLADLRRPGPSGTAAAGGESGTL